MKKFTIFILFIISSLSLYGQENKNIARIAIVPFYDNTSSSNFGYLPGSIKEAIIKSMHKKFEFIDVGEPEILIQFPENQLKKRNDENFIKNSSSKLKADILIYGSFTFDEKTNMVTIDSRLYFASISEVAKLDSVTNPVDNTIFQVTEKVSDNIVNEINRMVDIYSRKSGKDVTTQDDKKIINKESLETRALVLGLGLGGQFLFQPSNNSFIGFTGFTGEQFFNPWLSGYGSLAFGFSDTGKYYIKVPSVGTFAVLFVLLSALGGSSDAFNIFYYTPGVFALDGISFNIRLSDFIQLSPYLGLFLAFPLNSGIENTILSSEAGLRFNWNLSLKTRLSIFAGAYMSFNHVISGVQSTDFYLNSGLSFAYLIGK